MDGSRCHTAPKTFFSRSRVIRRCRGAAGSGTICCGTFFRRNCGEECSHPTHRGSKGTAFYFRTSFAEKALATATCLTFGTGHKRGIRSCTSGKGRCAGCGGSGGTNGYSGTTRNSCCSAAVTRSRGTCLFYSPFPARSRQKSRFAGNTGK